MKRDSVFLRRDLFRALWAVSIRRGLFELRARRVSSCVKLFVMITLNSRWKEESHSSFERTWSRDLLSNLRDIHSLDSSLISRVFLSLIGVSHIFKSLTDHDWLVRGIKQTFVNFLFVIFIPRLSFQSQSVALLCLSSKANLTSKSVPHLFDRQLYEFVINM